MTKLETTIPYNIDQWPYLHSSMIPNKICSFYGPDRESLFLRNCRYQPKEWIYYHTSVNYYFNDIGLRMNKNMSDLSADPIYVSGTSLSMGVGVDQKNIYSNIIEKELEYDTINYCGPTFTIKTQIYTFFNYIKNHNIPKVAIFEFPPVHGYTFFDNNTAIQHIGSHQPREEKSYLKAFKVLEEETEFCKNEASLYLNILRVFCKSHKIKLFDFSYYPDDHLVQNNELKTIDMDKLLIDKNDRYARDICVQNGTINAHPGIGVHKKTAEIILEQL